VSSQEKYKIVKEKMQIGLASEDDKKTIYQLLLAKEYELQKIKDNITSKNGTYVSPKVGEWIVAKTKFGFKRVKVERDELCGWG
jgi:hypothetical protein